MDPATARKAAKELAKRRSGELLQRPDFQPRECWGYLSFMVSAVHVGVFQMKGLKTRPERGSFEQNCDSRRPDATYPLRHVLHRVVAAETGGRERERERDREGRMDRRKERTR